LLPTSSTQCEHAAASAALLLHDTSTREQRQPHHTEYLVANTDGMSTIWLRRQWWHWMDTQSKL